MLMLNETFLLLKTWNSLPFVRKHKIRKTKTIAKLDSEISILLKKGFTISKLESLIIRFGNLVLNKSTFLYPDQSGIKSISLLEFFNFNHGRGLVSLKKYNGKLFSKFLELKVSSWFELFLKYDDQFLLETFNFIYNKDFGEEEIKFYIRLRKRLIEIKKKFLSESEKECLYKASKKLFWFFLNFERFLFPDFREKKDTRYTYADYVYFLLKEKFSNSRNFNLINYLLSKECPYDLMSYLIKLGVAENPKNFYIQ